MWEFIQGMSNALAWDFTEKDLLNQAGFYGF
jgi:hypothetical protein